MALRIICRMAGFICLQDDRSWFLNKNSKSTLYSQNWGNRQDDKRFFVLHFWRRHRYEDETKYLLSKFQHCVSPSDEMKSLSWLVKSQKSLVFIAFSCTFMCKGKEWKTFSIIYAMFLSRNIRECVWSRHLFFFCFLFFY